MLKKTLILISLFLFLSPPEIWGNPLEETLSNIVKNSEKSRSYEKATPELKGIKTISDTAFNKFLKKNPKIKDHFGYINNNLKDGNKDPALLIHETRNEINKMKNDLSKIRGNRKVANALDKKLNKISDELNKSEINYYNSIIECQGKFKEIAIGGLKNSERIKYFAYKKIYDAQYKKSGITKVKGLRKEALKDKIYRITKNEFLNDLVHGKFELSLKMVSQQLPSMEEFEQDGTLLGGFCRNFENQRLLNVIKPKTQFHKPSK